ncbi:translation initiation factor eIF-3 subunit 3 isoform 2 [Carpediemonas membranifera]|uniref:Translation initiation factor eIF-3 subunit 3 isoform 2 n=1 Tax=Carpediemonas membranifera TaxID=201153 RepID=A0A8J6BAG1_9EUKA|nr:translation initiation factor eIF-3 subunit 3 isoform 2 [Carpediemonas membranifera]|eukprot:KAG9396644.1 translation initiation factor eIF-3 subunit 3 isoform 2 [Carpediemonas membranifera]
MERVILNGMSIMQLSQIGFSDCTGRLYGFVHKDGVCEITYAVPEPSETVESSQITNDQFSIDMNKCLQDVHVDPQFVGVFRSVVQKTCAKSIQSLNYHAKLQKENPQACMLFVDPVAFTYGSLAIRAFTLTEKAMEAIHAGNLNTLPADEIQREIPVTIRPNAQEKVLAQLLRSKTSFAATPDVAMIGNDIIERKVNDTVGDVLHYVQTARKQNCALMDARKQFGSLEEVRTSEMAVSALMLQDAIADCLRWLSIAE